MSYNILPDGSELKTLIDKSEYIAIVCAERGADAISAGIAFADYLTKIHKKESQLFYAGDTSAISTELTSLKNIEDNFNKRSLRITLDYGGTNISSIDYYQKEEESKLILDVNSVDNDFNIDKIKYDFIGSNFDLIIVIGSSKLENLGYIYNQNSDIFNLAKIVNIDTSASNEKFGSLNLVDFKADSLSGLMLRLLTKLDFAIDKNLSKILLLGLSE